MLDYLPTPTTRASTRRRPPACTRRPAWTVKIEAPPDPAAPLKLLRAGRADVAISYEPELLLARDAGADRPRVRRRARAGAADVADALPGGARALARGPRRASGSARPASRTRRVPEDDPREGGRRRGSVKETNVGFNLVPAMVSKKVDATLGAFWNSRAWTCSGGPQAGRSCAWSELGVPTLRRADARRAARGPQRGRRVAPAALPAATAAGHRLLRERPVGRRGRAAARPTRALTAELPGRRRSRRRCRSSSRPRRKRPWGWQEPVEWAAYERWMRANSLLKRPPSEAPPLTNEFLPGEGAAARRAARSGEPQVLAGEARPRRVGGEEPAHLGLVGDGARVAVASRADELQVAEVARGDHVEPAQPVQREHLDGPRPDLADGEQSRERVGTSDRRRRRANERPSATSRAARRIASARLDASPNDSSCAGA